DRGGLRRCPCRSPRWRRHLPTAVRLTLGGATDGTRTQRGGGHGRASAELGERARGDRLPGGPTPGGTGPGRGHGAARRGRERRPRAVPAGRGSAQWCRVRVRRASVQGPGQGEGLRTDRARVRRPTTVRPRGDTRAHRRDGRVETGRGRLTLRVVGTLPGLRGGG